MEKNLNMTEKIRVIEQNLAITHLSFGLKNKNYFVISFILVVL